MSDRVFDAPEAVVVEAAHCTWCGAGGGEGCGRQMWGRWASEATHAQRWHAYWNETHGAHDQVSVFRAPDRARA